MGNLTRAADAWGASQFGYDALNRLSRRNTPRGDGVYYRYDEVSNLKALQYPQGTAGAYFAYDALNRMSTLDTPTARRCYFVYDASGNLAKKRLGNGVTAYYTYDAAEGVTGIRHFAAGGSGVAYFDFARDAGGRIMKLAREGNLAVYYGYDAVDRLTSETWLKRSDSSQVYAFSYSYDAAGNRARMRRERRGVEFENAYYVYRADNSLQKLQRLLPVPITTTYYSYDLNGSLVKLYDGSATYFEYGPHGLVTKVTPPAAAGNPWQFYYDGQLSRCKVDRGGTFGYFVWDGLNLLEERDAGGTLKARYAHGATPIAGIGSTVQAQRVTATTTYYQYPVIDHRGTVYAMLDSNKDTLLSYTLDAFGRQLSSIAGSLPNTPNDLIYQTNWLTVKIGNKWWGLSPTRLYDFDTGRFTQRDPLPNLIKVASAAQGNALRTYDPYGKVTVLAPDGKRVRASSAYGNQWTFTGRRLDARTGVMYYRPQVYDTRLGGFVGRDSALSLENRITRVLEAWYGMRLREVRLTNISRPTVASTHLSTHEREASEALTHMNGHGGSNAYDYVSSSPTLYLDRMGQDKVFSCGLGTGWSCKCPRFSYSNCEREAYDANCDLSGVCTCECLLKCWTVSAGYAMAPDLGGSAVAGLDTALPVARDLLADRHEWVDKEHGNCVCQIV